MVSMPRSPLIASFAPSPVIVSLPALPEMTFAFSSPPSVSAPVPPTRFSKATSESTPAPTVFWVEDEARLTVSAAVTPE